MRRHRRWVFAAAGAAALIWLGVIMIRHDGSAPTVTAVESDNSNGPSENSPITASAQQTTGGLSALGSPQKTNSNLPLSVRQEFERVGLLDDDPEASSRRLDVLSEHLKSDERKELHRLVLDEETDGDDRAVAVELLARSSSEEAVPLLESIAANPPPAQQNPQQSAFEQVLRARAIEGLGQHPSAEAARSLRRVADRTADAFLLDRTRRALAAREAHLPSPEKQDEDALRRVLQ